MNEESRVEKFNAIVRGVVVLSLTFGFIYGFVISKVVNTESFTLVFGVAMTWWFNARDKKQNDDAAAKNGKLTPPTPPEILPQPPVVG